MTLKQTSAKFTLREMQVPHDYEQVASLFNLIEPKSASAKEMKEEDKNIPTQSFLKMDENGQLIGFGRTRVVAENEDGRVIGYGAAWRAPWVEPGQLGSVFCVHPEFRRQGAGGMILSHLVNWANENKATTLLSEIKDWINESIPFVEKRGFQVDAHLFELRLNLNQLNTIQNSSIKTESDIRYTTLAEIPGEESEQKLYELFVETSKDNPGQIGSPPPFSQWHKEFFPEESRQDWVFIALDGDKFIGVTTLFTTEESGVLYTDYTGVLKNYRGRGIAKALKLISIEAALKAGAHTMTTDSEENNGPMQHINRGLGYKPGHGHYRILKKLT